MPIQIVTPTRFETLVERRREFDSRQRQGGGFTFLVDEEGNLTKDAHGNEPCAAAVENFRKCLDGTYDVVDRGVRVFEWEVRHPAVGKCICGARIELEGFTNTCEFCDRDYNWSGQLLASRSQWGEETGEHPSDILRIR